MSIYLNAGGHGMPPNATLDRMRDHLRTELRDGMPAAEQIGDMATPGIRAMAARLLGTVPAQTALGSGTSQFWLAAAARLPLAGRRVLISAHEWGTHVRYLRHVAPTLGLTLDIVPQSEALDPAAWAARIGDDLAAIMLQQVTSAQGLIYPVAEIGALPRPERCLVIVDAAQALGRTSTAMDRLGCDLLTATTRKWLRGPRTTAIMALSPRAETVLGTPASGLEASDYDRALRLGMGVALETVLQDGLEAQIAGLSAMAALFRASLAENERIAGWLSDGLPAGPVAPGHITLRVPAGERAALDARLAAAGIVAKWAAPAHEEPLSTAARDSDHALLRITPHLYNTAAEAGTLATALAG